MNLRTINRQQTFELLEKDAVLVTSTRRLSRHLTSLYSGFQQGKNRLVWKTPSVMPFGSWLEGCFFSMEGAGDKPLLLSGEQEETLWKEIISLVCPEHMFPGLGVICGSASRAMEIMIRYKLPWKEIESSPDQEIKAFARWARIFSQTCSDKNFLTGAGLTGFMTRSLEKSLFDPPKSLILAGFYEFDPVQDDLLFSLRKKDTVLYHVEHKVAGAKALKTRFNEFKMETKTAARHALNLVLENPGVRVGVVVPGLEANRGRVNRIFERVFHPETITDFSQPEKRMFNVSLGRPLSHYPLARFALVFLDLLRKNKWDIPGLGVILNSPFIRGGRGEFPARAALDKRLRRGGHPWRTAKSVLDVASTEGKPYHCPVLARIFSSALEIVSSKKKYQSPARWAGLFSRLLEISGWPDARAMNSLEYQTFQAFKEELSRLSRLEPVLERVTFAGALDKLKDLLGSRVFQAESARVPVQVMGLFEAAGLDFDHLWVMNLSADVLPAQSKPNPFLPVELQRKHDTPGSSPERELDLAGRIMESMLSSSRETVFSYSVFDDDREVLESPLLVDIPFIDPGMIKVHESMDFFEFVSRNSGLETISDDHGLPFTGPFLSGGARAFQDQALCPFKGYAAHRLGVRIPEEPVFSLTPVDRGNLVHSALMNVWREIGSLEELKEMFAQGSLESLADEAASLAVREFSGREHALYTLEFMTLEQIRLKTVIMKWLEKELERRNFEVQALEKAEYVHIGGIRIKTRMDRLDRLENGRLIIIDYKTGAGIDNVKNIWMGDRILEPQLPIYSLITAEKTSGLVLAQVNPRAFRFHGIISGDEISLVGNSLKTPPDLDMADIKDILEKWSASLETISLEIKEGFAQADPLPQPGNKTCGYCDFSSLCRIREQDS
jgi:ATP-dependent helicase/nuclease subunit B